MALQPKPIHIPPECYISLRINNLQSWIGRAKSAESHWGDSLSHDFMQLRRNSFTGLRIQMNGCMMLSETGLRGGTSKDCGVLKSDSACFSAVSGFAPAGAATVESLLLN